MATYERNPGGSLSRETLALFRPLRGSEKQVRWAERVRVAVVDQATADYEYLAARFAGATGSGADAVREILDEAYRRIAGQEDAGWWIDRRGTDDRAPGEGLFGDVANAVKAEHVARQRAS